jgi:diadenosine tetraphosphate (Ap4A) HIT family hydrolase
VSEEIADCWLCLLPNELGAEPLGNLWTVNIAQDAGNRPWLVVQSVRHVTSFSGLSTNELNDLGIIQRALVQHLESFLQVNRAHIHYLNESEPSHVHLHVTVSSPLDSKEIVTFLLSSAWPDSSVEISRDQWIPSLQDLFIEKREPSFLVRLIVKTSKRVQKLNFIYPTLIKLFSKLRIDSSYAAEAFVVASFFFFSMGIYLSHKSVFLGMTLSAFGLIRIVDIWATQLSILLDRKARILKSFERTLVLAVINVLELAAIVTIWAHSFFDLKIRDALLFGFQTATNRSETIEPVRTLVLAVDFIGTATALLLLVAVFALALGRLTSDRFEESRD